MADYNIGDVIQLNGKYLTRSKARYIAFAGHNFIVIDTDGDNVKVVSTTSDDKLANKESTVSVALGQNQEDFSFSKPVTYALLTTQGTVPTSFVRKKIGKLGEADLNKIKDAFAEKEINVRQVIESFKTKE